MTNEPAQLFQIEFTYNESEDVTEVRAFVGEYHIPNCTKLYTLALLAHKAGLKFVSVVRYKFQSPAVRTLEPVKNIL